MESNGEHYYYTMYFYRPVVKKSDLNYLTDTLLISMFYRLLFLLDKKWIKMECVMYVAIKPQGSIMACLVVTVVEDFLNAAYAGTRQLTRLIKSLTIFQSVQLLMMNVL